MAGAAIAPAAPASPTDVQIDDVALGHFIERCRRRFKLDLGCYKQEQVRRRLGALMHAQGTRTLVELADRLDADERAATKIHNKFKNHVTDFFRDPEAYRNVERHVLPALARTGRPPLVWSAGCSLGAEPISLAMMFQRAAIPLGRLIATDLDPTTIERARAGGPFEAREVRNLSVDELGRHVAERNGAFWVTSPLLRSIEYRVHDLIADPYPKGQDLVVCRNVLIYFVERTKNAVLAGLAASLRPCGFLFLGGTEIIHDPPALGLARRSPSLYQKVGAAAS
jgi:chemotaxis protein methyltransferase CheR